MELDEICIEQKQNKNQERFLVYKGYLQNNRKYSCHQFHPKELLLFIEKFSFKSQRYAGYSFDIKLYVNGSFQAHLFNCCEYRFHQGGFRINRLFLIENIDKSYPCQRLDFFHFKSNFLTNKSDVENSVNKFQWILIDLNKQSK